MKKGDLVQLVKGGKVYKVAEADDGSEVCKINGRWKHWVDVIPVVPLYKTGDTVMLCCGSFATVESSRYVMGDGWLYQLTTQKGELRASYEVDLKKVENGNYQAPKFNAGDRVLKGDSTVVWEVIDHKVSKAGQHSYQIRNAAGHKNWYDEHMLTFWCLAANAHAAKIRLTEEAETLYGVGDEVTFKMLGADQRLAGVVASIEGDTLVVDLSPAGSGIYIAGTIKALDVKPVRQYPVGSCWMNIAGARIIVQYQRSDNLGYNVLYSASVNCKFIATTATRSFLDFYFPANF